MRQLLARGLLLSLIGLFGAPGTARANGRFPRAERLLEDPNDANRLLLAATYGLLLTEDRGQSWHHICEAAFAQPGVELDPVSEIMTDGSILAGIYSTMMRSSPDGCDFHAVLGEEVTTGVPDFTLDPTTPQTAVALTVAVPVPGDPIIQLSLSSDDGRTWAPLGTPLPSAIRLVATVDVAPGDPDRVYVSGVSSEGEGVLLRSEDRGQSYTALPVPTVSENDETPYIAAIDPRNPDVVYLRTDVWEYEELDGVEYGSDRLLYTDDGGESFVELFKTDGKLFGFALSPDASTVLIGYGDPQLGGGRVTVTDELGIYRSPTDGGFSFEKIFDGSVTCLRYTPTGLYVCTSQNEMDFELGFRQDASFSLDTTDPLTPLLRLPDVAGPLECGSCTTGSLCLGYWPDTCSRLGGTACPAPTSGGGGGLPAECAGGSGGSGGGAVSEGGTPAGGGAGGGGSAGLTGGVTTGGAAAGAGTSLNGEASEKDSGCGCRVAGSAGRTSFLWLLAAFCTLLGRRRAARRHEPFSSSKTEIFGREGRPARNRYQ